MPKFLLKSPTNEIQKEIGKPATQKSETLVTMIKGKKNQCLPELQTDCQKTTC
ncbi:MAG: hypothetical protein WBA93_31420 [Microcoleaceae cyanobacterium]